jgi:serine protease inhibitor ecotin
MAGGACTDCRNYCRRLVLGWMYCYYVVDEAPCFVSAMGCAVGLCMGARCMSCIFGDVVLLKKGASRCVASLGFL